MQQTESLMIRSTLFVYLTLVIMNSIKLFSTIKLVGSVGKLAFCIGFIMFSILFIENSKIKIKLLNRNYFIAIASLLIIFALIYSFRYQNTRNLLINLAFPIYFIFYFFLTKLFVRMHYHKFGRLVLERIKIDILKIFRFTLLINLVVWFLIVIVSNANMYEVDGNFGGFLQDEIQMGLYAATGFLISFYLRFTNFCKDKSILNLVLMLIYLVILVFTSRNSLLIVLIAAAYFFVISKIENKIYGVVLFLLPILIINIDIFSTQNINEFTSGRWTLWTLATNSIIDNGVIFGQGLTNFNDVILRQNQGMGFHYLNKLQSLSIHSSYIELIGAGGVIALFIFIKINNETWKRITRIDKTIMLSILSGSFFESILIMPFMIISILFYLLLFCNNFIIISRAQKVELASDQQITLQKNVKE